MLICVECSPGKVILTILKQMTTPSRTQGIVFKVFQELVWLGVIELHRRIKTIVRTFKARNLSITLLL
jgi:hypothetical protein